ncbi:MAG: hypothetical protein WBW45_10840, partial [Bradyrhizobium sp.]
QIDPEPKEPAADEQDSSQCLHDGSPSRIISHFLGWCNRNDSYGGTQGIGCRHEIADSRRTMMSPTQFAVRAAEFNKQLEVSRHVGDILRMQRALAGLTSLNRAMYGIPSRE